MKNCPFYGFAYYSSLTVGSPFPVRPFVLLPTHGNQCALVVTSHSPCQMEIAGETPDWLLCPLVKRAQCAEAMA